MHSQDKIICGCNCLLLHTPNKCIHPGFNLIPRPRGMRLSRLVNGKGMRDGARSYCHCNYLFQVPYLHCVSTCLSVPYSEELASTKVTLGTNLRNLQHMLKTRREDGECILHTCMHTSLHAYTCRPHLPDASIE